MARPNVSPSGEEIFFDASEIIVSKTDLQGRITYANDVFQRVAGYTEAELIGRPHNLIRHPDMPRSVFQLLWDTIRGGEEIFAYVVNLSRCGGHYWVFAHVTPSFDDDGTIVGYHSSRRVPDRRAVEQVIPLYAKLREIEESAATPKAGITAAISHLTDTLASAGVSYAQFVFSLTGLTLASQSTLEEVAR